MTVHITPLASASATKVAEASLHFDSPADGVLHGLRLVGFIVQRTPAGYLSVAFPEKPYTVHGERRRFKVLRAIAHQASSALPSHPLTLAILAAYHQHVKETTPCPSL